MPVFEFIQNYKYQQSTGTLSNDFSAIRGLVLGLVFVFLNKKVYKSHFMKNTNKNNLMAIMFTILFSVVANQINKGMYNAKRKVYKDNGLSEDTAHIVHTRPTRY